MEAARGSKRFRGMGLDSDEIAAVVHCNRTHVENYLVLADAERDVQDFVRSARVFAEVAIEAVKKLGAKAGDFLTSKVDQAKAAGKAKVTASTIHGRALPRKVVSPLISGVDTFMQGLDANQRAPLLDTQEGRVAAETITIPPDALLDLFQAHGAVETVRAKKAEKQRRQAEAAAPAGQAEIPTVEDAPRMDTPKDLDDLHDVDQAALSTRVLQDMVAKMTPEEPQRYRDALDAADEAPPQFAGRRPGHARNVDLRPRQEMRNLTRRILRYVLGHALPFLLGRKTQEGFSRTPCPSSRR